MRIDRNPIVGRGLVNSVIDAVPFEMHFPGGYRYTGIGTKVQERMARGERGINDLDELCRLHDIAYCESKGDAALRSVADRKLADGSWRLYKQSDRPLGERVAAWLVTTAMNTKIKVGGTIAAASSRRRRHRRRSGTTVGGAGIRRLSRRQKLNKGNKNKPLGPVITLAKLVKRARDVVRGSKVGRGRSGSRTGRSKRGSSNSASLDSRQLRSVTAAALKAVKAMKKGRRVSFNRSRVLPLPRTGGMLPLLPIFAGLSAVGSLAGGAAGVAKAVNEAKDARRRLTELQRHNETMEAIALQKGRGLLFLKPYKKGLGLYMTPYVKQAKNC